MKLLARLGAALLWIAGVSVPPATLLAPTSAHAQDDCDDSGGGGDDVDSGGGDEGGGGGDSSSSDDSSSGGGWHDWSDQGESGGD